MGTADNASKCLNSIVYDHQSKISHSHLLLERLF